MTLFGDREKCYDCYRPQSSCICDAVKKLETQSCFVILMHQKEFQKTKNTTGRMTHLSLPHSHLFIGIDFSEHAALNALLNASEYTPYILYPDTQAHNLSTETLTLKEGTRPLFILIDSTWACSKKIMKLSSNLHHLPRVSFTATQASNYQIKKQPEDYCLSTIETTQTILSLLKLHEIEKIEDSSISAFLEPFNKMVNYQIDVANRERQLRFKISGRTDDKAI